MRLAWPSVVLVSCWAVCGGSPPPVGNSPDVDHARITLTRQHPTSTNSALNPIAGEFALYSPVIPASGVLVAAQPPDACGAITLPFGLDPSQPFVLVAKLGEHSQCSAMEQGLNAQRAGAVALLNMAPQHTSYIYLLERAAGEEDVTPASIAHVAISGLSGRWVLDELAAAASAAAAGTDGDGGQMLVTIDAVTSDARAKEKTETEEMRTGVAVVAGLAAVVIVLCYRGCRSLCIKQPFDYIGRNSFGVVSSDHPPTAKQHHNRERMAKLLSHGGIGIVRYNVDAEAEVEICAICRDQMSNGDDVRDLWCNHPFHVDCIDPWLLNEQTCPLCQDNVLARATAAGSDDGGLDDTHRHLPPSFLARPVAAGTRTATPVEFVNPAHHHHHQRAGTDVSIV